MFSAGEFNLTLGQLRSRCVEDNREACENEVFYQLALAARAYCEEDDPNPQMCANQRQPRFPDSADQLPEGFNYPRESFTALLAGHAPERSPAAPTPEPEPPNPQPASPQTSPQPAPQTPNSRPVGLGGVAELFLAIPMQVIGEHEHRTNTLPFGIRGGVQYRFQNGFFLEGIVSLTDYYALQDTTVEGGRTRSASMGAFSFGAGLGYGIRFNDRWMGDLSLDVLYSYIWTGGDEGEGVLTDNGVQDLDYSSASIQAGFRASVRVSDMLRFGFGLLANINVIAEERPGIENEMFQMGAPWWHIGLTAGVVIGRQAEVAQEEGNQDATDAE
ncbi:MAG: hypothetical protein ABH859_00380 [Pseudomonadota bacterium]